MNIALKERNMVKIEVYIKKRGERDRKVVWVQRVLIRGESLMIAGEGLATVSEVVLFGYAWPQEKDDVMAEVSAIMVAEG